MRNTPIFGQWSTEWECRRDKNHSKFNYRRWQDLYWVRSWKACATEYIFYTSSSHFPELSLLLFVIRQVMRSQRSQILVNQRVKLIIDSPSTRTAYWLTGSSSKNMSPSTKQWLVESWKQGCTNSIIWHPDTDTFTRCATYCSAPTKCRALLWHFLTGSENKSILQTTRGSKSFRELEYGSIRHAFNHNH